MAGILEEGHWRNSAPKQTKPPGPIRTAARPPGAWASAPATQWRRVHDLPALSRPALGETRMRLIIGIILGCALTVGGAYIADTASVATAQPVMVNWDVVAKNLDSVTTLARASWKKITG